MSCVSAINCCLAEQSLPLGEGAPKGRRGENYNFLSSKNNHISPLSRKSEIFASSPQGEPLRPAGTVAPTGRHIYKRKQQFTIPSLLFIFQMAGVDHRGLRVLCLPRDGLLFVTFHGISHLSISFCKNDANMLRIFLLWFVLIIEGGDRHGHCTTALAAISIRG